MDLQPEPTVEQREVVGRPFRAGHVIPPQAPVKYVHDGAVRAVLHLHTVYDALFIAVQKVPRSCEDHALRRGMDGGKLGSPGVGSHADESVRKDEVVGYVARTVRRYEARTWVDVQHGAEVLRAHVLQLLLVVGHGPP